MAVPATIAGQAAVRAGATGSRGGSLARVRSIARNTFREAVRDRVLYNLVAFVLLLTVASIFLGAASASQDAKIIIDLGLSAMLLFGVFIAIFVGVGLVYKEIERRTLYVIFAKPVARGEFLLGKYLGLCLTLAVNVAVMGAGVALALLAVKGGPTPLALRLWPAVGLIYLELALLTAVALLFSAFASPLVSAFASLAVFVIGQFSAEMRAFGALTGEPSARVIVTVLYYLLPNLSNFNAITPAAYGVVPSGGHLLGALAYAILYVAVLLAAATLLFARRDFK